MAVNSGGGYSKKHKQTLCKFSALHDIFYVVNSKDLLPAICTSAILIYSTEDWCAYLWSCVPCSHEVYFMLHKFLLGFEQKFDISHCVVIFSLYIGKLSGDIIHPSRQNAHLVNSICCQICLVCSD